MACAADEIKSFSIAVCEVSHNSADGLGRFAARTGRVEQDMPERTAEQTAPDRDERHQR